jgi:tetratricopeptide (TPR) repeat protein
MSNIKPLVKRPVFLFVVLPAFVAISFGWYQFTLGLAIDAHLKGLVIAAPLLAVMLTERLLARYCPSSLACLPQQSRATPTAGNINSRRTELNTFYLRFWLFVSGIALCTIIIFPNQVASWSYLFSAPPLGHYQKSIALFGKAIQCDPSNALAWFNRGYRYERIGKHKEAVADLNQAISLNANLDAAIYTRAEAYAGLGQFQKAMDDANRAVSHQTSAESLSARAIANAGLGQFERGIAESEIIINTFPKRITGYMTRGRIYAMMGKFDAAVKDYTCAIQLKPIRYDIADLYKLRSLAFVKLGKEDLAKSDLALAASNEIDGQVKRADWISKMIGIFFEFPPAAFVCTIFGAFLLSQCFVRLDSRLPTSKGSSLQV